MARKPFTPSEEIAILRAYREHERREAKKRQGRPGQPRSGKLPGQSLGDSRDRLGAYLGKGGHTIDKQWATAPVRWACFSWAYPTSHIGTRLVRGFPGRWHVCRLPVGVLSTAW